MKAYGRVNVYIHRFLTSGLFGGEWSASCPCRFTSRGNSPTRYPLHMWFDRLQSRSERHDEEKIVDPSGTRNSDPSVVQPVASRHPGSLQILDFSVVTIIINGTDCTQAAARLHLFLYTSYVASYNSACMKRKYGAKQSVPTFMKFVKCRLSAHSFTFITNYFRIIG
jgi:hypothetical protein